MHHDRIAWAFFLAAARVWLAAAPSAQSRGSSPPVASCSSISGPTRVRRPPARAMYVSRLDLASGKLTRAGAGGRDDQPELPRGASRAAGSCTPSNEVASSAGREGGSVSGFAVDRQTGKLTPLNQQSSGGRGPAHLVVDKAGRNVLVANYGGGSVAVLPIGADGMLKPHTAFVQHTGTSVNPTRQKGPHAHSINVDPGNRFAYRRRPRPRQGDDLPLRRGEGHARAGRSAVRGRCSRAPGPVISRFTRRGGSPT